MIGRLLDNESNHYNCLELFFEWENIFWSKNACGSQQGTSNEDAITLRCCLHYTE